MSVGKKLKDLRVKNNKTLKEQGEVFGVSLNTVYRWEHGLTLPKTAVLNKIANYYDVPLNWLLKDYHENDTIENQLLKMFNNLSENNKYKVFGYIERIYVEDKGYFR